MSSGKTSRTNFRVLIGIGAVIFVISLVALVAAFVLTPIPKVERLGKVPDFSFEKVPAGTLSLADLKGSVWVGGFIFTHCKGICPVLGAKMKEVGTALSSHPDFKLVSFTIDPARDTLTVLGDYQKRLGQDVPYWIFSRPTESSLKQFADGLKLILGDVGDFTHTSRLVLVDRRGEVRGYYQGIDFDQVEMLKRDAVRILSE